MVDYQNYGKNEHSGQDETADKYGNADPLKDGEKHGGSFQAEAPTKAASTEVMILLYPSRMTGDRCDAPN